MPAATGVKVPSWAAVPGPAAEADGIVAVVAHVEVRASQRLPRPSAAWAVGVAVVGAGDVPAAGFREVGVGDRIAVGVAEAGEFGALGDEEVVAVAEQAEGFVEAGGELVVGDFVRVAAEDVVEQPDLSFAEGGQRGGHRRSRSMPPISRGMPVPGFHCLLRDGVGELAVRMSWMV